MTHFATSTLDRITEGTPIGPFRVDAAGHLSPADPDRPIGFGFRWRGRVVHADLGHGALSLRAAIGRVPSTAGHARQRPAVFDAIGFLPDALPPGWHLRVLPDHRLALERSQPVDQPVTACGLVSQLVGFVLELAPYLDLLKDAGVATESAPEDGTVNTWPG